MFLRAYFYLGHFADHLLSKRSHASSQLVTFVDIRVLLSGTQVGRSMSVTPDAMIEIGSLSGPRTGIPASLKK